MDGEPPLFHFAIWYLIFLGSLVAHEAAHALVALWGGDDTAYRGGQVTLNPWPHIRREPLGTVLIPVLTYFSSRIMMGWASAPFDPGWGKHYPRRLAAMSAAGPAANLLLVLLFFAALKALLAAGVFAAPDVATFEHMVGPGRRWVESGWVEPLGMGLSIALNLNLLLFLFNLIPLPPLDGSAILAGLLPEQVGRPMDWLRENPLLSLVGLILVFRLFDYEPAFRALVALLHPGF